MPACRAGKLSVDRLGTDRADLERAAALLRAGQLVAFPTETVYGLGADAANAEAVARIFAAKQRPADHPVIVHLPDAGAMDAWGRQLPAAARDLAASFWPGPLTLIVRRAGGVPDILTGSQDTIGLRVPEHPVARALLNVFGGALAAPSANRFGQISPTRAEHVACEFGDEVAAVIDGGPCAVGVESTIVDLSGPQPRVLRPGMIGIDALAKVLGQPLAPAAEAEGPRAPGRLASHYAPRAPMQRLAATRLVDQVRQCLAAGERVVVLAHQPAPDDLREERWIEMPQDAAACARALYAQLRRADTLAPDRILIEEPPASEDWDAIRDRIRRASHS